MVGLKEEIAFICQWLLLMFGLYAQKALVTCPFVFFGVKLRDKKMSTYCAIV